MNRREKRLAAGAGALLLSLVAYLVFDRVDGWFTEREIRLDQLQREIRRKEHSKRLGMMAAKSMAEFEARSLPGDPELARTVYQTWLLELVQQVELADVQIAAAASRSHRDLYQQIRFTMGGRGNLEQLTRFLYEFHAADILHRIRALHVKPVGDSKHLDLTLSVEALSLAKANPDQPLTDRRSTRLAHESIDEYTAMILGRNLFGPPNNPPRIDVAAQQSAVRDRTLSFDVKATDADKLDRLVFSLGRHELAGATLDPRTGRFEWKPTVNGDYEVTVRVTDDGYPPKFAEQLLSIRVSDPPPVVAAAPPPPQPKFDSAPYTKLSAVMDVGGRPEIWLNVQTTGEILKLHVGDRFEIGSVEGQIVGIGERTMEIEVDGRRRIVALGTSLAEQVELD